MGYILLIFETILYKSAKGEARARGCGDSEAPRCWHGDSERKKVG